MSLLRFVPIIAVAFGSLLSTGCRNRAADKLNKPVLTVSIEPQRWMLERIVGDKMAVSSLLARGGNPENYEPAFSHLASLEQSEAYFCVGNSGFEEAILQKVRANNPSLPIIVTSDSIALIHDEHAGHNHGVDPHVWSSAKNARTMAENMYREVIKIDPRNKDTYTKNLINLLQSIDSVNSVCDSILTPAKGSSFLVWHPSLSYFARDYGLNQVTLGAEGKELSVKDTQNLINQVDSLGAKVFLVQKDFDNTRADAITAGRLKVATIDPLNYDWASELVHTAKSIAEGK